VKIHHVTVSAFARSKEESTKVRKLLSGILPPDSDIVEAVLEPETEGGVFTKELYEVKAKLVEQKSIKAFTRALIRGLDGYDRKKLLERVNDSVDDDCNLYLRLSKTEAEKGNFVLENRDSIHVTFKLAAFPAKKETAQETAKTLIEDEIP
jgi:RNA-binding protein